jgi:hypothetical protein
VVVVVFEVSDDGGDGCGAFAEGECGVAAAVAERVECVGERSELSQQFLSVCAAALVECGEDEEGEGGGCCCGDGAGGEEREVWSGSERGE